MDPYYYNFPSGSQASEDESVPLAQSIGQDFDVPPSLQASTSTYHSAAVPQSYSYLDQDGHGAYQPPQMSGTNHARSFRPSVTSGSSRTPSLSNHPYHQARLRHYAVRASAHPGHQGGSRPSTFPAFLAASPMPDTVIPYNMVIGDRASTLDSNSSQLSLAANTPSSMGNLAVAGQTPLPSYQTPPLLPYTLADRADIEYAQYRYGDRRCFYQCRYDLHGSPCNKWIVGDRTRVLRHLRNHHHLQTGPAAPASCRWDECTHSRPMKQENLSRHVVMHLGVKWRCPHCRRLFSRDDAVHRHIERMVPGMDVTDAEIVPGHDARAVTEPQSRRARVA